MTRGQLSFKRDKASLNVGLAELYITLSVMVIVVGNGIGNSGSNPGQVYCVSLSYKCH